MRFSPLIYAFKAAPPSSILFVLHRNMPKPADDNLLLPCQFAKPGLVGGRQHSFACGGERHRTVKVAMLQMPYGSISLANRRVSDVSIDMVRVGYGSPL